MSILSWAINCLKNALFGLWEYGFILSTHHIMKPQHKEGKK